jgi:hypothetical protein
LTKIKELEQLLVEEENGPDDFIDDVRKDAFNRFQELIDVCERS